MADTIIERAARAVAHEGMHRFERGWRRILRRPVEVQVGWYRMAVPGDMPWAFSGGVYYEQELTHWLPLALREAPGTVFYDIGANYGYYSLLLAQAADSVHAFEPVSRTRAHLISALTRNQVRNVAVYPVALSDHAGSAQIASLQLEQATTPFTTSSTGSPSARSAPNPSPSTPWTGTSTKSAWRLPGLSRWTSRVPSCSSYEEGAGLCGNTIRC